MTPSRHALVFFALLLAGCTIQRVHHGPDDVGDAGEGDAAPDASDADAGAPDAARDGGGTDAGAADAGLDASPSDAGADAGASDAGSDPVDAWVDDAGSDAGCTTSCPPPTGATSTACVSAMCEVAACSGTLADCNGTFSDGCEVDTSDDRLHCGDCTTVCSMVCVSSGCDDPVAVAGGGDHTCARRASGAIACWGANPSGQLGDGTPTRRLTPVTTSGIDDALRIATGTAHSCALRSGGTVYCWGENGDGQLGRGAAGGTADSHTPVRSGAFTTGADVAAGDAHTCAVLTNGQVLCWGRNTFYAIGDGTTDTSDRLSPTPVATLTDAEAVGAGNLHSCALRETGQVVCWGGNSSGQLGDGATHSTCGPFDCSNTPVAVVGVGGSGLLNDATEIAVGFNFTCALRAGGAVVCWGLNSSGQLGNGGTSPSSTPVPVSGVGGAGTLSDAVHIAAGGEFACAVRTSGQVVCWGANDRDQLGAGSAMARHEAPVAVSGLSSVSAIGAGRRHACAVTPTGAYCWGANTEGQVGDGFTTDRSTPVPVAPL